GCLIEVQAESQGQCKTIIGIGLNVNLMPQQNENAISQNWTSLRQITQYALDRNLIAAALIENLLLHIYKFEKQGLEPFLADWKKADYLRNKNILVTSFNKSMHGLAKGINNHGHLLLELSDGSTLTFASGDTSV